MGDMAEYERDREEALEAAKEEAIAVRTKECQELSAMERAPKTLSEIRTEQSDSGLKEAYANAGKLNLTQHQIEVLTKPFDDEDIEILPNGNTYIEHILISERLTEALGGSWVIVNREEHTTSRTEWKDNKEIEVITVFARFALIVDGCLVGETVAGKDYWTHNKNNTLDDVIEGVRGIALRRMAAKSCLCCGNQVWKKNFNRRWKSLYAVEGRGSNSWKRKQSQPQSPPPTPKTPQKPAGSKSEPREAKPIAETAKTILKSLEGINLTQEEEMEWWRMIPTPVAFGKKWPEGTLVTEIRDENGGTLALKHICNGFRLVGDDKREKYVKFKEALEAARVHYKNWGDKG